MTRASHHKARPHSIPLSTFGAFPQLLKLRFICVLRTPSPRMGYAWPESISNFRSQTLHLVLRATRACQWCLYLSISRTPANSWTRAQAFQFNSELLLLIPRTFLHLTRKTSSQHSICHRTITITIFQLSRNKVLIWRDNPDFLLGYST